MDGVAIMCGDGCRGHANPWGRDCDRQTYRRRDSKWRSVPYDMTGTVELVLNEYRQTFEGEKKSTTYAAFGPSPRWYPVAEVDEIDLPVCIKNPVNNDHAWWRRKRWRTWRWRNQGDVIDAADAEDTSGLDLEEVRQFVLKHWRNNLILQNKRLKAHGRGSNGLTWKRIKSLPRALCCSN